MSRLLFSILLIFSIVIANAQLGKEAWHWRFGSRQAIDFNTGVPVIDTCNIQAGEGCASMSDPITGDLLFYTDGITVYDKLGHVMPNGTGLFGNYTSTQSALIIPKPNSTSIYYIITCDAVHWFYPANKGVNYSVVDLSLNNGLGDIISKNILLTPPPTAEKLVGVRHCNGLDYWIITHPANSQFYYSYLVTSNGIKKNPVISTAAVTINVPSDTTTNENLAGYLKASPDGKKLAAIFYNYGTTTDIEILDFDNSTGQISNPIPINLPNDIAAYGASFSPDSKKLYVSFFYGAIYQFDLSVPTPSAIINSKNTIHLSNYMISAMQLGPDGKIYVAHHPKLSVIHNPNNYGTACNFQPHISSYTWCCGNGYPNFIDGGINTLKLNMPDQIEFCDTNFVHTLDPGSGFSNYQWSTGETSQSITVTDEGDYWVSLTNPTTNCKSVDTVHVYQYQSHNTNISGCDSLSIDASIQNSISYTWENQSTSPIREVDSSGIYTVSITSQIGCIETDTFNVTIHEKPEINLGEDIVNCIPNELLIKLSAPPNPYYLWSNGSLTKDIYVNQPGIYWVDVTNIFGCKNRDSILVNPNIINPDIIIPNIVTPNNDGINDLINFGVYSVNELEVVIFDRWGNIVFESKDPNAIWKPNLVDGTFFMKVTYSITCDNEYFKNSILQYVTVIGN